LLYVAATRARRHLFLTYPRQIMTPDRKMRPTVMSPFLREINPGLYYQREQGPTVGDFTSAGHDLGLPDPVRTRKKTISARIEYLPGMSVLHPLFGPGKVKSVPGPRRVEISFDRHGDKILHLDYAKLEII